MPTHELSEQIKALKAANSIERVPERKGEPGPIAAVTPVTTRIRQRHSKYLAAEQSPASLDVPRDVAERSWLAAESISAPALSPAPADQVLTSDDYSVRVPQRRAMQLRLF